MPTTDSDPLFGGSSALSPTSDDLFGSPPTSKAPPTANKLSVKREESPDDLFGSPPTSKAPPTANKLSVKREESPDDLFGSPPTSKAPPTANKLPVKRESSPDDLFAPPIKPTPAKDSLFESVKVITKPLTSNDDNLFGDAPLPIKEQQLPVSTKPVVTKSPPAVKGKPPPSSSKSGGLFDDSSDDELFAIKPSIKPPPTVSVCVSVCANSISLFLSLSTQQPVVSPAPGKRKPAGAVSLFGGVDPFGAAGPQSPKSPPVLRPVRSSLGEGV